MFIGFFAVLFSEFVDDLQYHKKIPVKYLLDGTYEGNDDTFDYYKLDDDSVAISLRNDSSNAISIPETATIKGTNFKVTGIYRDAFKNKKIASITIPKSITVIDYEAFMSTEFTSNTKVEIPYSVTQMGTACFFKSNITEIYFSDGVTQNIISCDITTSTDESETTTKSKLEIIPDYCFAKCTSLKNISFSTSLTTIKEHAFEYCSSISTLAFLTGLSYIGSYAFNYCSSLSTVYIPSTMVTSDRTIEEFAFLKCNNSLNFYVSCTSIDAFNTNNKYWNRKSVFDGNVYTVNTQTSDIYANGLWLYEKDSNSKIKILKYIGEIDSTGYLAFPNTIENSTVVSFNKDCLSGFENKIKYLFFPKYLEEIPPSYFSSSFSSLEYVGCVDGDNCYNIPRKTNMIDLSQMESLHKISESAFRYATAFKNKVTEIKLPANLQDIADAAFYEYVNCEKISFETNRTNTNTFGIGSNAFNKLGYNKEAKEATSDIVFPKELTAIWYNVFENAKCIRSLKFEGGSDAGNLTIYSQAFFDCSSLESLIIEDRGGTTTINSKAFAQWNGNYRDYTYKPSLQTVYLPSKISIASTYDEPFGRQIRCTFYFSGNAPSGFKDTTYYFMNKQDEASSETGGTDDMTYNSANKAFKLDFTYHCGIYENVSLEKDNQSKNYILYNNGDLSYVLNKTDNTAVVSRYHFDMQNQSNLTKLEVTVPDTVTFDGNTYTINEIGTGAFGNSDSYDFFNKSSSSTTYRTISKIILPKTIKKIGHYAFFRCVGLEEVGYYDSTSSKYKMPTALESIGEMAFALSGIKYIDSLNSNCDFLMYSGSSQISNATRNYGSPFLNCPQLEYISLTSKDNSKLKLYNNNSALCDSHGYILVVFPKYTGNDKSFVSTKFYYGAYRCVSWITQLTISTSDYPNSVTDITPQAIFAGYNSQDSIRQKCRFKSRITVSKMDDVGEIDTLILKNDSGTFVVPQNVFYGTKIKKVIIPYGNNGAFPAYLLDAVSALNNNVIFQVQKNSSTSDEYTNTGETPKFLDLSNCGYTSISENAFKNCNLIETVNLTGVQTINSSAFEGSSIKTIDGTGDLVTINSSAFKNCTNITGLNGFNNVTTIGSDTFLGCTSLQAINGFNKLTTIGDKDFQGCTKLQTINGFENLITINQYAFNNCTSLTTIDGFNNVTTIGNNAFQGCTGLQTITGFNNVTTIGNNAFENCNSLKSIDCFKKVVTIGNYAFQNCTSLTKLNLPKTLKTIGDYAFQNDRNIVSSEADPFVIPNSVTQLGIGCFREMDKLVSVKFESGSTLTSIPNSCFDNCDNLKSIVFPENLESIGNIAFWGCGFEEITIPDTVTTIGSQAFEECHSLKSIVIPKNVTTIGWQAFYKCYKLTSVTFEENTGLSIEIGTRAFSSCNNSGFTTLSLTGRKFIINSNAFESCSNLTNVTIGSGVTKINDSAFSGDKKINTITFEGGDEVLYLGSNVFSNCAITKLDFSNRAVSIGKIDNSDKSSTFSNCTSLKEIIFGSKTTYIGVSSFEGCTSLNSITFGSGITDIKGSAFKDCTSLTSVDFSTCNNLNEINGFEGCTSLDSVNVGSASKIGDRAFYNCSALTSLDFKNVTSLGSYSFSKSGLTSINFTSDLTSLGNNCFEGCTSLVSAKFSNKSFSLSKSAFKNCTSLKSVIFLGNIDNGYGDKPFEGCTSLVLVVFNSGFDKKLNTQIFKGLTNLSKSGSGIVCLDSEYDSSISLGDFTKISDTYQLKIAYSSVPSSGSIAAGTYIWAWVDTNKKSVKYYDYNDSTSTTTLPASLIKRKVEETSY